MPGAMVGTGGPRMNKTILLLSKSSPNFSPAPSSRREELAVLMCLLPCPAPNPTMVSYWIS